MLTDTAIRTLKPAARVVKKSDGGGLFLQVESNGSKLWRIAYRFHGKQKTLSGGAYPTITLADARKWRDTVKGQLARGEDPSLVRKQERIAARGGNDRSFEAVTRSWHASRKAAWDSHYAGRVLKRFEDDVFPRIGSLDINDVDSLVLLDMLRQIEARGVIETTHRIKNYCGKVFRYAVALGKAKRDPSRDISDALHRKAPVRHRAKIEGVGMAEFYRRLKQDAGGPTIHLALKWTILTMARTDETRFARWGEFEGLDGAEPTWRLPAERMKMGKPHIVPLPKQAVKMLRQIRRLSNGNGFLFPVEGSRSGVFSENAMIYAMYRMGYHGKATVHGFRGTASTVLNETGQFDRDWIERQLAHVENDAVRAAYNAAEWLPQRRKMMQWWADWLDAQGA